MALFLVILACQTILIFVLPRSSLWLAVSALMVPAALRGNVGYDTCEYRQLFVNSLTDDQTYIEPAFWAASALLRLVTDDSQAFLVLVSAAQGWLLYRICRSLRSPKLFLVSYQWILYYPFSYNILRNGLGALLVGLLIVEAYRRRPVPKIGLVGPLVHAATLPGLILAPTTRRFAIWLVVPVVAIGFAVAQLGEGGFVYTKAWKLVNIIQGDYNLDRLVAWHVYLSIGLGQIVIFTITKNSSERLVYTLIITGTSVAEFYFRTIGRISLVGYLGLLILLANRYPRYSPGSLAYIFFFLLWLAITNTGYPLLFGDTRIRDDSRVTASEYHIVTRAEKLQCYTD